MQPLSRKHLLSFDGSRHFASEPHVRIQVVRIPGIGGKEQKDFFAGYHGELIVICLEGRCRVETRDSGINLAEMDQALLLDGEGFRIVTLDGDAAVVEMIWTPGPNPCRFCWETDGKFFKDG
jgi:hypothetical protein